MKRKRIMILLLSAMCMLTGCRGAGNTEAKDLMSGVKKQKENNVPQAGMAEEETKAAVKDFAVRLIDQNYKNGEDTLISPLSVLCALSMTANGAKGETLAQMEEVFGTSVDQLNRYLSGYRKALPQGDDAKLSMADSVWFKDDEGFEVNQTFLHTNKNWYDAGIYKAPFDEGTLKEINTWVSSHTDGMIGEILDQIPEDARMYLVNALAFDAKWQEAYTEYQVREDVFTREDGSTRNAEFMYSEESRYLEDENTTGFLKPYKGGQYAFAALLPSEGLSLEDYLQSLSGEKLEILLDGAENITVDAVLPKFEAEYSVEMSNMLIAMGMEDAFDGQKADLSGIGTCAEGNLCIGRVLHKTRMDVNEAGTKAGAATVVEMLEECAMEEPMERKSVRLDRPFVYLLIDQEEKMPIFLGVMAE